MKRKDCKGDEMSDKETESRRKKQRRSESGPEKERRQPRISLKRKKDGGRDLTKETKCDKREMVKKRK